MQDSWFPDDTFTKANGSHLYFMSLKISENIWKLNLDNEWKLNLINALDISSSDWMIFLRDNFNVSIFLDGVTKGLGVLDIQQLLLSCEVKEVTLDFTDFTEFNKLIGDL